MTGWIAPVLIVAVVIATAAIFAALSELISTYGEEPVAVMCQRLPERVRGGEFSLASTRN